MSSNWRNKSNWVDSVIDERELRQMLSGTLYLEWDSLPITIRADIVRLFNIKEYPRIKRLKEELNCVRDQYMHLELELEDVKDEIKILEHQLNKG